MLTQDPPKSYLREMLSLWLQWVPGDARGSGGFANKAALVAALNSINLAGVALELHSGESQDRDSYSY